HSTHLSHFPPLFFNPPPTPAIYPLSLHDALPISPPAAGVRDQLPRLRPGRQDTGHGRAGQHRSPVGCGHRQGNPPVRPADAAGRSEEHTSELQSRGHLVCRLLLEKKKKSTLTTRQ